MRRTLLFTDVHHSPPESNRENGDWPCDSGLVGSSWQQIARMRETQPVYLVYNLAYSVFSKMRTAVMTFESGGAISIPRATCSAEHRRYFVRFSLNKPTKGNSRRLAERTRVTKSFDFPPHTNRFIPQTLAVILAKGK